MCQKCPTFALFFCYADNVMRHLYFLILVLLAPICVCAQGQVSFFEEHVDCGVVKWKEPVTVQFTITNNASRTMTITNVHPDCSCTAVTWTRTPVAPGGQAQVQMTYDAELLGTFEKQVAVYTNLSPRPTYATMRGRVVMQAEAFTREVVASRAVDTEDFMYTIGDLHLTNDNVFFDDVQRGDSPTVELRVLNTSETPYTPQVMHLPAWLSATPSPATILPGPTGTIVFRLHSEQLGDYGLTQRSVYLSRFPGDVVGHDNELAVSATILPRLSRQVAGPLPALHVDTVVQLGRFNGKEQLKTTLVLRNDGHAPLLIGKLQVYNPGLMVSLSTTRIKAGGKAKLTITATPSLFDFHGYHRILLITNDPKRPKVLIDVQADK